jgi:hypothetical protein
MQWSLERIIPQVILGDSYSLKLIKEYLKKIKNENFVKIKKG